MIEPFTRLRCPRPELASKDTTLTSDGPVPSRKWQGRKKGIRLPVILLGIILGVVLAGSLYWATGLQGRQGLKVASATTVSALGVLQAPVYNLTFSSSVTGAISDIYVNIGQKVVANQALARLGQNTYEEQLNAAQVAVDAAHDIVNAARRHVERVFEFIQSTVMLARTVYNAELDNQQAVIKQANANINFAKVTLAADQSTLNAVIKASEAAVSAARLTLSTALATCQTAAASAATATSTVTDGATTATLSTCTKTAEATFKQAVTAANVAVVIAQGQVQKDQAALTQAIANANVDLVAANGRVNVAADGIPVAQNNPEKTNALLALSAANFTYRTALAALLVAEKNLALTTLRAPHAGVVSAIIGTIGGQPGAVNNLIPAGGIEIPNNHGNITFIQIIDPSHIDQVLTYVDETDIQRVHVGQATSLTLKADKNHPIAGTITAIAPNGLGFPGTMPADSKFVVIVSIADQDTASLNLYAGMTGTVAIST